VNNNRNNNNINNNNNNKNNKPRIAQAIPEQQTRKA
jgi:hypothetical protein